MNKSCVAALKSYFAPGRVSCTVSDVCVCVSKQRINIARKGSKAHQNVCIVEARWRMITCDGIVVVSQFLGEYFHPYPLTLCFKGQGEGV